MNPISTLKWLDRAIIWTNGGILDPEEQNAANVVCEMAAILPRPQRVNEFYNPRVFILKSTIFYEIALEQWVLVHN